MELVKNQNYKEKTKSKTRYAQNGKQSLSPRNQSWGRKRVYSGKVKKVPVAISWEWNRKRIMDDESGEIKEEDSVRYRKIRLEMWWSQLKP